jgi:hypothetical protein
MSTDKKIDRKVRILQRTDGQIFAWSPILEAKPDMHPGQQFFYADGSQQVQLDRSAKRDLDVSTVTQREALIMDENVQLRQQIADLIANRQSAPLPPPVPLAQGETPIPSMPAGEEEIDLTDIDVPPEEPVAFAPEPVMMTESALSNLRKDEICSHIVDLDRAAKWPASSTKADLVQLALELQAKRQG